MLEKLSKLKSSPIIKDVRGAGLFLSIETAHDLNVDGNTLSHELIKHRILAKATHTFCLRLGPPLTLKEEDADKVCKRIAKAVKQLEKMDKEMSK